MKILRVGQETDEDRAGGEYLEDEDILEMVNAVFAGGGVGQRNCGETRT